MAITRRQFVTRMGALAAVAGMSQMEIAKISEAFAGNSTDFGGTFGKPRVVWIHGAECTGCSTSLLGVLEDGTGNIYGTSLTTGDAVGAAGVTAYNGTAFPTLGGATRTALYGGITTALGETNGEYVNIADVVIDVIDLQYHETVMGMAGDLAAQWLIDFQLHNTKNFILVVEGALQDKLGTGAWGDTGTSTPWCSIGLSDDGTIEHDMPTVVRELARKSSCLAIIPIGQCACFGGYPGCKPSVSTTTADLAHKGSGGFDPTLSQTGAKGVYSYLSEYADNSDANKAAIIAAAAKVINVPGCPTNPWWFVLTVTLFMADYLDSGNTLSLGVLSSRSPIVINSAAVDYARRLKAVYPVPIHTTYCPRYTSYTAGVYASHPGDTGCLKLIGCKGMMTNSLCGVHGWNNAQAQNRGSVSDPANSARVNNYGSGGHCTTAGHPCMGCTEKGYPDSFVPFVKR